MRLEWLPTAFKNTIYLEELAKSFEANIYSLYAKELLNITPDNLVFKIDMKIKPSSYDIYYAEFSISSWNIDI